MKRGPAQLHRRRFLQVSAAAAACSVAVPPSAAAASSANPLIDTHVYLGHWPLRRLSADTPAAVVAQLRRAGVTQAWAGTLDGLLHKDIYSANLRLVETCRNAERNFLIPIGTVNPTLPDWEEDIRRCHEVFKMPGIRLHPTYHGYTLDDPRFICLLELATARRLFVQLVAHLTDSRRRYMTPRDPQVDLAPLSKIVPRMRHLRIVISNPFQTAADSLKALATQTSACFDFPRLSDAEAIRRLASRVSADRMVYGSSAPLLDVDSKGSTHQLFSMTTQQSNAMRHGNAERIARPIRRENNEGRIIPE